MRPTRAQWTEALESIAPLYGSDGFHATVAEIVEALMKTTDPEAQVDAHGVCMGGTRVYYSQAAVDGGLLDVQEVPNAEED